MDQEIINLIIPIGILLVIFIAFPLGVVADSIDKLRFIYMKVHNIPIRKSKITLFLEKHNIIKNDDNNNKPAE